MSLFDKMFKMKKKNIKTSYIFEYMSDQVVMIIEYQL